MKVLAQKANDCRVLVTGASGFLGSHLCRVLISKGYKVNAFVRKTSNLFRLKELNVELSFGGLFDTESIKEAISGVDYVIHCAGLITAKSRDEFFKANVEGTRNLLEIILKYKPQIKKFVYISSQAAGSCSEGKNPVNEETLAKPLTFYGESKLSGELESLKFKNKIPVSVIRPPAIYGPSDKPTLNFFKFAKYGIIPVFTKEETYISICHVEDVVKSIVSAMESERSRGEVFYVSDGEVYSWIELWRIMCEAAGKKGRLLKIPKGLFFTFANIVEKAASLIGKPTMLNYHKATDLTKSWAVDISKIRDKLKFTPDYTLKEGTKQTYKWYKENHWL